METLERPARVYNDIKVKLERPVRVPGHWRKASRSEASRDHLFEGT
jgi:hypothetical protein